MLQIIIKAILSWFCILGGVKSIEWIYKNAHYYIKKVKCHIDNYPNYVTRLQILTFAREHHTDAYGLCSLLHGALQNYGICCEPNEVFPLFTNRNARLFGAKFTTSCDYWWPKDDWETGRLQFLDWLIEQYKNDPTDLTTLNS
jgi:hypothetical protein